MSGTRICYFGRYDPHNLRNTITTKCLARAGAEIVSIRDDRSLLRRTPALIARGRRAACDLVIVPFRAHSDMWAARRVARRRGVPLIFDPLTSRYEERVIDRHLVSPHSVLAWWYRTTDAAGCRAADRVLLETDTQIGYFVDTFDVPREKCRRLWLGADDDVMRPQPASEGREETRAFTAFFYGRFSPLHGIEHIIEAAALLERRRCPVRFIIVGAGQTYASMRALAAKLGVSTVEFREPVPYAQLATLMSSADVCLGTFGMNDRARRVIPYKVFDALAVGRPVITADTPAIREALVPERDVATCPSGDSEALADRIAALEADGACRREIGEHGHRVFRERFSLDAMTRDLVAIVGEFAGGSPAASVSR